VVNVIALLQCRNHRGISLLGAAGAGIAGIVLVGRLVVEAPAGLALLAVVGLIAAFGRPRLNRWTEKLHEEHHRK
jgi:hypothetical protein